MMAFNCDATVTSSQDEVWEGTQGSTSSSFSEVNVKQRNPNMNPHLKMVAKVFPTVRKEDKPESEDEDSLKDCSRVDKKLAFPWLVKFSRLCKESAGCYSYERLDYLMNVYIRNICKDVKSCYKKRNRASNLKLRMNDSLKFFHMMYRNIRKPVEVDCYHDRMSDLIAMYLDLEIAASRRGMENPRKISARLISTLFILLENSKSHILNAILKARFFVKRFHDICIPIIRRILNGIPTELDAVSYIQYILVFRKWRAIVRAEEKRQISLMAAEQLLPPAGFVDEFFTTDKYNGLLPPIAKCKKEKFTFMLMQAPDFSAKDVQVEGYVNSSEPSNDSDYLLGELKPSEPVLYAEEQHFLRYKNNPQIPRRSKPIEREIWLELGHIIYDNKNNLMNDLYEDKFFGELRKHFEIHENLRLQEIKERALKIKKEDSCVVHQPTTVCAPSSIPWRNAECFGFATSTSTQNSVKNENAVSPEYNIENNVPSESRLTNKEVPKMEADSQSQDDVVFIDRIDSLSSPINIEDESFAEEHDSCKRDVIQTPILRAVVRPENIEQLSLNEKELGGRSQSLEMKEKDVCESRNRIYEVQIIGNEQEVENIQEGRDLNPGLSEETVDAEAVVVSSLDVQSSLPEESKTSNELIYEECTRLSSSSDGIAQLWNEVEGQNCTSQSLGLFVPNDPSEGFISQCFPDDSHNWSRSHDIFLGQYGDEFMSQYDIGNTTFPDFYNDQQDMVFTEGVNIGSPPLIDMMNDEVYQKKTTHWEDWSMMVSEANTSTPGKSSSSPEMDINPQILEQDSPKTVKGRRKKKSKKRSKKGYVKDPSPPKTDLEQLTEKITKDIPVKEVKERKKGKQTPPTLRLKRGRPSSENEEENKAAPELEAASEPKKKRGRSKNILPPPPPQPALPPPPPPTNRQKPGGKKQNSTVTKKKSQSRRRK